MTVVTAAARGSATVKRSTLFGLLLAIAILPSCETMEPIVKAKLPVEPRPASAGIDDDAYEIAPDQVYESVTNTDTTPTELRESFDFYSPGTGQFVARKYTVEETEDGRGEVTLNFEETNLREVVKVVLGDVLNENYVMDPSIQGTVSLQTSKALSRDALIPTLELLLRSNGAALVYQEGLYNIVPRDAAIRGMLTPMLGESDAPLPRGYRVLVVPLQYVAALEMHKILEPFTETGNVVRVDIARNLLVLAASGPEMDRLLDIVELFDVDWLAGMSMGLFTPDYVSAATLVQELGNIFGDPANGPLAGLLRFVEIERLNAVLVVTSREEYLKRAAQWIDQLDRDIGTVGRRLYVYHVQNGKAIDLAFVLNQVFVLGETTELPVPELAPGLEPIELGSQQTLEGDFDDRLDVEPAGTPEEFPSPVSLDLSERVSMAANEGLFISEESSIRIIPDEVNNALLVMATEQEYEQVEAALRRLDIPPLQVLIETTIAEISLTGDLRYGLEWFFKNGLDSGDKGGVGVLDLGAAGLAAIAPGFSYTIADSASNVRVVLNVLASQSRINIISSPTLMVLNNQTSTINVGEEVPVTTQQQQSTAEISTVVNNIEFRDTGVILSVTPRVNAGGLVTMEIEQEVSNVRPGTGDSLTPTIQQRKISSTVAVQSSQTIVLGGLIRENETEIKQGIPILYELPVIGPLFGSRSEDAIRTELIVLITPRVVQNSAASERITEEFRNKMQSLKPLTQPATIGE